MPPALSELPPDEALKQLVLLDPPLENQLETARAEGASWRFVARLAEGCARVGLERLGHDDPLAGGRGTDNRVAIWSDRYSEQPLIIQGPGAGAHVTAAALLDDALKLHARAANERR